MSKFSGSKYNCFVRFLSPRISVPEPKVLSEDTFKQGTALNSVHKSVGGLILEMFTLQVLCLTLQSVTRHQMLCSLFRTTYVTEYT